MRADAGSHWTCSVPEVVFAPSRLREIERLPVQGSLCKRLLPPLKITDAVPVHIFSHCRCTGDDKRPQCSVVFETRNPGLLTFCPR